MFDCRFVYSDGFVHYVKNVTAIRYQKTPGKGYDTVSGDDILNYSFPVCATCLCTSNGIVTISGENLRVIEVIKQDS